MAKPITITEDIRAKIQTDFLASLINYKMADGVFRYETSMHLDQAERATVVFSPLAFSKMTRLLLGFPTEVGWHGTAERSPDDPRVFLIKDIFVYPQTVTGATVNTDQAGYETWLDHLEDDTFNHLRMHGHSHVDFSTAPSQTDLDHQRQILSQLTENHFYIFMIFNKRFERNIKIYDYPNNILYENTDVDVRVGDLDFNLDLFFENAQKLVVRNYGTNYGGKNHNTTTYGGGQYSTPTAGAKTPAATPKTQPAAGSKKTKTTVAGGGYSVPPANSVGQLPGGIQDENHFSHSGYPYTEYDAWD